MYSFSFYFTIRLSLDPYSKRNQVIYNDVKERFVSVCAAYNLRMVDFPEVRFDGDLGHDIYRMTVSLKKETVSFREAYNLLKICEASLDMILESGYGPTTYTSYSVHLISDS